MGMDDACADFVADVATLHANEDKPLKPLDQKISDLLAEINWYAERNYPEGLCSTMRWAVERVLARPNDQAALLALLILTDNVTSFYAPNVGQWCADFLRKIKAVQTDRCWECGKEIKDKQTQERKVR
jgi:hypothetical protein